MLVWRSLARMLRVEHMMDEIPEHQLRNSVLPMVGAAALAYQRLFNDEYRNANFGRLEVDLTQIANALADLLFLYTFDIDRTTIRKLTSEQVAEGYFLDSGRVMVFQNGAQSISRIGVHKEHLQEAIAK